MKRAYERDPDFMDEEEEQRNDLVLGAPALLGIFFALALICAVCFGFGYSSGHDLHLGAAAQPSPPATPEPVTGSFQSRRPAPEPIAPAPTADAANDDTTASGEQGEPAPPAKPTPSAKASEYWPSGDPQPGEQTAAEAPPTSRSRAALAEPAAMTPSLAKPLPGAAVAPGAAPSASSSITAAPAAGTETLPGAGMMVQIAAVSRAADANTLATALRHDGFAAIVRTATGDPFFHVQVGPFPSFTAAKAMRSRLADSGYNAFIKP